MLGNTIQSRLRFNSRKLAFAKALLSQGKGSVQGLTIIECLIGILVVTAVISAITPPIMLTVATRVQNRRAAQASQLAQAAVDRVRRLVETGSYSTQALDRLVPYRVDNNIQNATISAEERQIVDFNQNNQRDFGDFRVQVFRTDGIKDQNDRPVAFKLGVRVYAFFPNSQNLQTKRANLGLTTATGNQQTRPLAVLYTDVALSDNRDSLTHYCRLLNGGTQCPQ